jgi:Cu-Zn family superoxide dismutase
VPALRDNYANIPERYAPYGPDEMTQNTGDAGGHIAGVAVEG